MCHNAQLIFVLLFFEIGCPYVAEDGLQLLASSNPPTSASQIYGIKSMSYHSGAYLAISEFVLLFLVYCMNSLILFYKIFFCRGHVKHYQIVSADSLHFKLSIQT